MYIIPPSIMRLRIKDKDGKGIGLWLPLFLIWPIILVLLLLVIPILAVVQLFTAPSGIRPLSLVLSAAGALHELRGLTVDVAGRRDGGSVFIDIA
jgi:hypothetical protein